MMLLWLLSWPYARKHVLRTILTAAGIALGTAVFVGMHTANRSVLSAFTQTIDRIAGRTDLQVTAGESGFGEDVLETVQSARTVRVAVPVIEAVVESNLEGEGNLLVLGVDMTGDRSLREYDLESGEDAVVDDPLVFLAQPDSLIVSKELADRARLMVGSNLPLGTTDGEKAFTVRGIMKPAGLATAFGGSLAIMDVYAAQKMFGRGRTFDRIDVGVSPGTAIAAAEDELRRLLGPGFEIQPPATRGRQAEAMLSGYNVMVNISSAFALFVGMFIIYASFATAVSQRRVEIGILRALGATRGQIRSLYLLESAALGLLASTVGLVVGVMIARMIASAIGPLIGELYGIPQQSTDVATSPAVLALALCVGAATSIVAAAIPARDAARVDPVHTLKKGGNQHFSSREGRIRMMSAAVLGIPAIVCLIFSIQFARSYDTVASRAIVYAGYASTIGAVLLLMPLLAGALARAVRPVLGRLRPIEGTLAADSIVGAPRRTSGSVAALMLSLALVLAFAGMASATYRSIVDWIDTTMNPDLFVLPSERLNSRSRRFPGEMAEEIAVMPGVQRVQTFRSARIPFGQDMVMAVALEMRSVAETVPIRPLAGNRERMFRDAAAGEGLIVSDNLAQLHRLSLDDMLEIAAPYGTFSLPIVGIISDYTDQRGAILMDRDVFIRYWRDDSVGHFRVYALPGAGISDVRRRIIDKYAGQRQLFVLTNEESRGYVLRIADQWFGLMNVQIAVAVLVAVLGIVNTLTVSIADRRRELGVLQAVGALRGQIRRTIWIEALTIVGIGLVLGCSLGAVNLYYILEIARQDVMGMQLEYRFPVEMALALVPIMMTSAWLAALWPAETAVRSSLIEALEYE